MGPPFSRAARAGRRLRRAGLPLVTAVVLLLAPPRALAADVTDYLGRRVVDVRVDLAGEPVEDPELLELVETRVGEPLSMVRVRETIDHLTGLGRFEDVRVYARPAPTGRDEVTLQWTLIPVERITRISFAGSSGFPAAELRAAIEERGERAVAVERIGAIIERLRGFYEERGFRSPEITHRLLVSRTTEGSELELTIRPGPRTTVAQLRLETPSPLSEQEVFNELRLRRGQVYDQPELERRGADYEERLRDRGHYEASVEHVARFSESGAEVSLTVRVDPGPLVRVTFAGDPLPEDVREDLVSIRQERSVDEDLIEDSARNIRRYLRDAGYREASVRSERSEHAGELLVTFTVQRGPLHRLSGVEWTGVSALPQSELAPLATLAPQDVFVDQQVATIASAITELYQVRGFATASVALSTTVGDAVAQQGGGTYRPVSVRFDVSEGARTLVGQVAIDGASHVQEHRIRAVLGLQPGRPFYRPQLTADREGIEQLYRNEGFAEVAVAAEPALVDGGARADVRWEIREGPQTRVDHVLVTGNVRTSAALIRREIALAPGQPLGEDARVESQRTLAALGLFRRVRITELPHGVGPDRDVLIEVEEAPGSTIAYGGGVEVSQRLRRADSGTADERLEFAPRGFFEIGRQNLGGKNRAVNFFTRASLRARDAGVNDDPQDVPGGYGLNEYRLVGTFREPRVFETPGDAQLTGFMEQAIRSSFSFRRFGVRAEYARRITESFVMSGRYTLDRTRLYNAQIPAADQPDIDRLFPQVRLSTFTGSILRDSRDDVLDPREGSVLGFDGSVAARAVGSEVGFVRSFLQLFSYRRLPGGRRFVLVGGARLGLSRGFAREVATLPAADDESEPAVAGRVTDLPASERFFAGGDTTVRGFALDRLGTDETLNAQGFPTGGNGLLVFNVEVRAPYWKGVGPVGFVDAGNVFRRARDVDLSELRAAAGFGVRYLSPIGPLRVDVGFKLDPRSLQTGARERRAVFHISLGQAF